MSSTFKRTIEDFVCEHCKEQIQGNGYTNHCPNCLWSKHVDNNPGDRACLCQGMMEPVKVEYQSQEYVITYKCLKCGIIKKNKASVTDNIEALAQISKNNSI